MSVDIKGKTYRNLPEQVEENANNIQWLLDTISSFGNVMRYCGSVATYADLPTEGNRVGDVYNVLDTGNNYAWDGETWDEISSIVDLSNYVKIIETSGIDDLDNYISAKVGDIVVDIAGFAGIIKTITRSGGTITAMKIVGIEDNNVPTTYIYAGGEWSNTEQDLSKYVDLSSAQTIPGLKTFINGIEFTYDPINYPTYKYSIKQNSLYNLDFLQYGTSVFAISTSGIYFGKQISPKTNNTYDIGNSNARWKDLYLSNAIEMKNPNSQGSVRMEADAYNGISFFCNGYSSFLVAPFTCYARGNLCTTGISNKNLGSNTYKWGDLYLSGSITDGTNAVTPAELAALKWNSYDITNIDQVDSPLITGTLYEITVYLDSDPAYALPSGTKEVILTLTGGATLRANFVDPTNGIIVFYHNASVAKADITAMQYR